MRYLATFASLLILGGGGSLAETPAVIPAPRRMELREGRFTLGADTKIHVDVRSRAAGEHLAERLRSVSGLRLPVLVSGRTNDTIAITASPQETMPAESYRLEVTAQGVVIEAADAAGAFYGVLTLQQLLPPAVFSPVPAPDTEWAVPAVAVEDGPRFPWRGLLLDVARHFYSVAEVERVIDLMAAHKFNRLQLHLVDDQGWRIEIKSHPRLTEISGWRRGVGFGLNSAATSAYGKDGRYGGYYTQADIRHLVQYAAARHVVLVPEIEMPGHASGALAAYPELSCHGGPYDIDVGGGVFDGVFCAGKEATFQFVEEVLDEVIQLFPSQHIHIGGDEVPKRNWQKCSACQRRMRELGLKNEAELQCYFISRVQKIIAARERTLMGWSEIREGGLVKNAALMDWIGGGRESALSGHDVVMTPTQFCYFDYYQSTNTAQEPKAIGGYVPLEKVYAFEPLPAGLPEGAQRHILGAQGNLWTEYIASIKHVEYMLFPRACALAEVAWSPNVGRDFSEFNRRLEIHRQRLNGLGVNYRPW